MGKKHRRIVDASTALTTRKRSLSPAVDSDSDFDQQAGKRPTNDYQDSKEEEGVVKDDDDYEKTENTEDGPDDREVE